MAIDKLQWANFTDKLNSEINEFARTCYANGVADEQDWTPAVHLQFKELSLAIEHECSHRKAVT